MNPERENLATGLVSALVGMFGQAERVVSILAERLRALNQVKQTAVSLGLSSSAHAGLDLEEPLQSPDWTSLRLNLSAVGGRGRPTQPFHELSRIGSRPRHRAQRKASPSPSRPRSLSPSHRFNVVKSSGSFVHSTCGEFSFRAADKGFVNPQLAHVDPSSCCCCQGDNDRSQICGMAKSRLGSVEWEDHSGKVDPEGCVDTWVEEVCQASPDACNENASSQSCLLQSESMGIETPWTGTAEENEISQCICTENFSASAEVIILEDIEQHSEEKTQSDEQRGDMKFENTHDSFEHPPITSVSFNQTKAMHEHHEYSKRVPLRDVITKDTENKATDMYVGHAMPEEKQIPRQPATTERFKVGMPKQMPDTKVTESEVQMALASPTRPLTDWTNLKVVDGPKVSGLHSNANEPVGTKGSEKNLIVPKGSPDDYSGMSGSKIRYKTPVQRARKGAGSCSLQLRRSFGVHCLEDATQPTVVGLAYSRQAGIVVLDGANDTVKVFSRQGQLQHLLAASEAAHSSMFQRTIAVMEHIFLDFVNNRRSKGVGQGVGIDLPSREGGLKSEGSFATIRSSSSKAALIRSKTSPLHSKRCLGISSDGPKYSSHECPLGDDSRSSEDEEIASHTDKTKAVTSFNRCCSGDCEEAPTQQKPSFFCVQRNGNVIIVERETALLTVVDPSGKTLLQTSTLAFGLQSPIHVVNDGGSTLLLSDKEAFLYVLKVTSRAGQGHCRRRELPSAL